MPSIRPSRFDECSAERGWERSGPRMLRASAAGAGATAYRRRAFAPQDAKDIAPTRARALCVSLPPQDIYHECEQCRALSAAVADSSRTIGAERMNVRCGKRGGGFH
eukprot:365002-Chlamydomonas_euryale.AAC.4